jgi:hypothetical protein
MVRSGKAPQLGDQFLVGTETEIAGSNDLNISDGLIFIIGSPGNRLALVVIQSFGRLFHWLPWLGKFLFW